MKFSILNNVFTRAILIIIVLYLLIFFVVSDRGKVYDIEEGIITVNKSYVSMIILNLDNHRKSEGALPENLDVFSSDKIIKNIIISKTVRYSKKGFKDKNGNIWFVIIEDKETPNLLFVGNFFKDAVIPSQLLPDENLLID